MVETICHNISLTPKKKKGSKKKAIAKAQIIESCTGIAEAGEGIQEIGDGSTADQTANTDSP